MGTSILRDWLPFPCESNNNYSSGVVNVRLHVALCGFQSSAWCFNNNCDQQLNSFHAVPIAKFHHYQLKTTDVDRTLWVNNFPVKQVGRLVLWISRTRMYVRVSSNSWRVDTVETVLRTSIGGHLARTLLVSQLTLIRFKHAEQSYFELFILLYFLYCVVQKLIYVSLSSRIRLQRCSFPACVSPELVQVFCSFCSGFTT